MEKQQADLFNAAVHDAVAFAKKMRGDRETVLPVDIDRFHAFVNGRGFTHDVTDLAAAMLSSI